MILVNFLNFGFELLKTLAGMISMPMEVFGDGNEIGVFVSYVWALSQVTTA